MITEKNREIVKATAPVLAEHGETITKVFYKRLFNEHPELKDIFNMSHQQKGTQPRALAHAVFMYAKYIDQLEVLASTVETIAQKHASLSVTKEMYPLVGKNLLIAIQEVLGEAATPSIIDAWAEAYQFLADILIGREEELYVEAEQKTGGYRGKEEFIVSKKVKESSNITSFYLQPANGQPLLSFQPGQYIAVTVTIPSTTHLHTRNYSLSVAPSAGYWRISIKKEEGNPKAIVSNYLHEHVQEGDSLSVGIPAGDFVLLEEDKPIIFLAGGVGITPLISMYQACSDKKRRTVTMVQCVQNSEVQAFRSEIQRYQQEKDQYLVVYSNPLTTDKLGEDYHYKGFLTKEILTSIPLLQESMVYCCGPKEFMQESLQLLNLLGVPESQVQYEFFGPVQVLHEQI